MVPLCVCGFWASAAQPQVLAVALAGPEWGWLGQQWADIGPAVRAFVRLDWHRWTTGRTWFGADLSIIRAAARHDLKAPEIRLPEPATA